MNESKYEQQANLIVIAIGIIILLACLLSLFA